LTTSSRASTRCGADAAPRAAAWRRRRARVRCGRDAQFVALTQPQWRFSLSRASRATTGQGGGRGARHARAAGGAGGGDQQAGGGARRPPSPREHTRARARARAPATTVHARRCAPHPPVAPTPRARAPR
jgi:hypothetical protein